MKQNDWIVLGVCGVFSIAMVIIAFTQARTPEVAPAATVVDISAAKVQAPAIPYTNGLPQPSNQSGPGGGGGTVGSAPGAPGAGAAPGTGGPTRAGRSQAG
jgi:hypothetical protein